MTDGKMENIKKDTMKKIMHTKFVTYNKVIFYTMNTLKNFQNFDVSFYP